MSYKYSDQFRKKLRELERIFALLRKLKSFCE